jgi:hypothetical protein
MRTLVCHEYQSCIQARFFLTITRGWSKTVSSSVPSTNPRYRLDEELAAMCTTALTDIRHLIYSEAKIPSLITAVLFLYQQRRKKQGHHQDLNNLTPTYFDHIQAYVLKVCFFHTLASQS